MSNYEFDPQAFWIVVASFCRDHFRNKVVRPTHRLNRTVDKYVDLQCRFHWIIPLN